MMSKNVKMKNAMLVLLLAVIIIPCVTVAIAATVWMTGQKSSENTLSVGNYEINLDKSDEQTEKLYFSSSLAPYNGEFKPSNYAAALAAAEADNGATIADAEVVLTRNNLKEVNYTISLVDGAYGNNAQLRSGVHITAFKVSGTTGEATSWTHVAFDDEVALTGAIGGGSQTYHIFMTAEGGFAHGLFKFDLVLTSMVDDPDTEPEYEADYNTPDLRFYDTFDNYTGGWQITQDGTLTTVAQNESSVTVTMSQAEKYGFITRKSFAAPTGAFTYSFKTKINSALEADRSVAEFSVRSSAYLIRVVLVYDDANPVQGQAQDDYGNSAKQFNLDVTEWHDYQVVVDENYSYALYVDGALAWSGAAKKNGGGDMIKIGADSSGTIPTSGIAHFDLDYFKLEKGARASAVRLLTGKFVDGQGQKLTVLDGETEDISAVLLLENTFGATQTVTVKMELIDNDSVVRTVTGDVVMHNGEIKESTLTMDGISGDPADLKIKVTLSVSIVKIAGGMVLAPASDEDDDIDDRNTFIFEAENADLSQCGKADSTGNNTYGNNTSINYGSSISNPEDYKPSNDSWAGNFNNRAGNKITWTIMSDSVSTAKFVIRMSNGVWNNNDSSKDMDITPSKLKMIMNGTAISYTPFMIEARNFAGTGASANAALMMFIDYTVSLELPIQVGVNTFVLELVTTGSGPNVDCLRFTTDANLSWVAPNTAGAPLPDYPWYLSE